MRNLEVVQALGALLDELCAVSKEDDLAPLVHGSVDDLGCDRRLASPRRGHDEQTPHPRAYQIAHRLDRLALVIAKDYLHLPFFSCSNR